jgi:hypothetical protein
MNIIKKIKDFTGTLINKISPNNFPLKIVVIYHKLTFQEERGELDISVTYAKQTALLQELKKNTFFTEVKKKIEEFILPKLKKTSWEQY